MRYADWTNREWSELLERVKDAGPTNLSDAEIRECAETYMKHGPDSGKNRWSFEGVWIAVCVDKVGV